MPVFPNSAPCPTYIVYLKRGGGYVQTTKSRTYVLCACLSLALLLSACLFRVKAQGPPHSHAFDNAILLNAGRMLADGRRTFRFDTFGDEAFWGDTLKLH